MMLKRLIDSVILIDHLNGIDKATDFLSGLSTDETAISVVTRAEVLAGVDAASSLRIKRLLDRYQLLVIDGPIADLAADLRRTQSWKLPDAFQAALAMHYKIFLLICAETHEGNFSLNADKNLTLQGGWDASFENQNGTTTLQGAPKAPQGSLT